MTGRAASAVPVANDESATLAGSKSRSAAPPFVMCYRLGRAQIGSEPCLDSEQFRSSPRTCWLPVSDHTAVEPAINGFAAAPGGALIVIANRTTITHRKTIIALAAKHHLPAIYSYRYFVNDGGLASYGADLIDLYRRAASYVDRILKGEKPADLPVQQPNRYELVINLKTARVLGLDVPWFLQQRADEVIE